MLALKWAQALKVEESPERVFSAHGIASLQSCYHS